MAYVVYEFHLIFYQVPLKLAKNCVALASENEVKPLGLSTLIFLSYAHANTQMPEMYRGGRIISNDALKFLD